MDLVTFHVIDVPENRSRANGSAIRAGANRIGANPIAPRDGVAKATLTRPGRRFRRAHVGGNG